MALPQHDSEDGVNCYCGLADVKRHQGQVAEAKQLLINALHLLSNEYARNIFTVVVIQVVAYCVADQQKSNQAISLFGWVDAWNKTKGIIQPPVYQEEFDRYLSQARERLTESEFNAAWAEGQSMSQEQVLALAEEVVQ